MISNLLYHTISEQIAVQIKKDIITEKLKEGDMLREMELSKKYNVSRGPVRDALKILSKEGFIISKPNVGARIAPQPTAETLALIIDIRRQLEIFVVNHCFEQFSNKDFQRMERLLSDMYDSCIKEDIFFVKEYDMLFHGEIVRKYPDKHLYELWKSIVNRMMFNYSRHKELLESYNEHKKILCALEKKDKEALIRLLRNNIR